MSLPLPQIDHIRVTDFPEPRREGTRIRYGQYVSVESGDTCMHVAGFGYVTNEVAIQLARELLAAHVLIEQQDQAARR